MTTIENDILKVDINPKGAELSTIWHKIHHLDYLWSGDAAYWGKKSPVLFPIVGTLKGDTYWFNNQAYRLSRHGFARDYTFAIESQRPDAATFLLSSNDETLKNYPFEFEFRLHYSLVANRLNVTYDVRNTSAQNMYFSVGGHPAFKLPLVEGTVYEDYFIQFEHKETTGRYPLSIDGLLLTHSTPLLTEEDRLNLKPSLFYADAVVLKYLQSESMTIKSDKTPHGLKMIFKGFPFLGIWAAKNAPFLCLEPWCGVADSVTTTQQLTEKEGIVALPNQAQFERTWSIEMF